MDKKKLSWTIVDAVIGVLCVLWLFVPLVAGPMTGDQAGAALRTLDLPTAKLGLTSILCYGAYFVAAFGLFAAVAAIIPKFLGPLGNPLGVSRSVLRILASFVGMICFILPFLSYGDKLSYYATIPWTGYAYTVFFFALSAISISSMVKELNLRDPVYREYNDFRRSGGGKLGGMTDKDGEALRGVHVNIRSKLFISFISIFAVTLLVLIGILLTNYRSTILKAVSDGARNQVEQASNIYKINLGDSLAMFEFIDKLNKLNDKAEFRFDSFRVYSNRKDEVLADNLSSAQLPPFQLEYSSEAPGSQFPPGEALDPSLAMAYAKVQGSQEFFGGKDRSISFVAPIMVRTKEKRDRIIGFSQINYREDEVYEPYFRTQASVIALTFFFVYIAIVLIYVVGNIIVNPLLFLRMSVRKISDALRKMTRGEARVSANSLQYEDKVATRDEIKSLSGEIGDMVTVIKGIIPYISASTLKQAEKGIASSAQKDLAFLFTDIRGFTTLCEGMEPNQVVNVLNRYLDLETELILANHGDVDKFVGDEMMAFFDGPDKEINACRAAMQIRHAMMEEKEKREREGQPTVAIGIGINSGGVVFGSVGARERMDFTSIGDTVNLAARLEGANKAYGSKSIITEAVFQRVNEIFLCRELDFIAVKGKNEPVRIYEILQEREKASPKLDEIRDIFEKGLACYRKREWEKAAAYFKKDVEKYKDGPSQAFLERLQHFSANPPPDDWDGVFRMTVK